MIAIPLEEPNPQYTGPLRPTASSRHSPKSTHSGASQQRLDLKCKDETTIQNQTCNTGPLHDCSFQRILSNVPPPPPVPCFQVDPLRPLSPVMIRAWQAYMSHACRTQPWSNQLSCLVATEPGGAAASASAHAISRRPTPARQWGGCAHPSSWVGEGEGGPGAAAPPGQTPGWRLCSRCCWV